MRFSSRNAYENGFLEARRGKVEKVGRHNQSDTDGQAHRETLVSYPGCAAYIVTNALGSRTPTVLQVVVVIMARLNPRIRCTGLGARC